MSARPSVPRLADEDLDLLISRSLDGDLSPKEASDLEAVLAHDADAMKRKEELARLIAEVSALPAPAPPFALATRVNSNVSEKGARGGSLFHRFGFHPPPGMAVGAMTLLGIVAVAITILRPAPRVEGPVDVFFTEGAKSEAKDAGKADVEKKLAALAPAAPQAAGAIAPATRAISGPARSWSVALRGDGAQRWMLRRAPEGRPSAASGQASAFRITLDVDGRVTAVRALDARPVQPALLAFVRGLVFAPVGAVADGIARDEKAKAERADGFAEPPAEQSSEIDVEVSAR